MKRKRSHTRRTSSKRFPVQQLEQRLCLTPNILVSATSNLVDRTVIAMDSSGSQLTSWEIPLNDSSDFGSLRGISHSDTGKIYGYNGTHRPFLTVYDPLTNTSEHYSANGMNTHPDVSSGSVAVSDDYVFATDMRTGNETNAQAGLIRFDRNDPNTAVRSGFTADGGYRNLAIGLDGFVYAITASTTAGQDVDVFDPISLNHVRRINLEFFDYRGIAVNDSGEIFVTTANSQIRHYTAAGQFVKGLTIIPTDVYRVRDIDISTDGDIVVGQGNSVVLTTESLTTTNYISLDSFYPPFVAFAKADIPPPQLALSATVTQIDEGTDLLVTVRRTTTEGITAVGLTTDWPEAIDIPEAIAIPSGSREISFTVSSNDDRFPDANKLVTLSATAPGFGATDFQFTVAEDDSNEIEIRPVDLTVAENGTTTATVKLGGAPRSNVVVQLTSEDDGDFTLSAATLTFTKENWDINQNVVISGVIDAVTDGDKTVQLTAAVLDSQSDDAFDSAPDTILDVLVVDIDAPGLITKRSGSATENGDALPIPVALTVAPASNVVVNVTIDDPAQVTANTTQLTFTPANWNVQQIITFTAVDDSLIDGDVTTVATLSIDDVASDDAYDSAGDSRIDITAISDDVPSIQVSQTGSTTVVSEAGLTDSVLVALSAQPVGTVVLQVVPVADSQISLSAESLTFTTENWNVAQEVTIAAVDDDFVDPSNSTGVRVQINEALSSATYVGVQTKVVPVVIQDDEIPGFTVAVTGSSTEVDENMLTVSDSWTIRLDAKPAGPVVINLDGDQSDLNQLVISETFLVFLPSNWNQPQTVTFFARDDVEAEGDMNVNVTVGVSPSGANAGYAGVEAQTHVVRVIDNDFVRINVSGVSADIAEGETTRDFQVQLAAEPTSDVVVVISPSDDSQLSVSQTQLTFTPADWQASQVFNITAIDDQRIDGTFSGTVSVAVDPDRSDDQFDGAPVHDIAIEAADNDREVALDVDGNLSAAALSDGILIFRYLAGFTGNALLNGVADTSGTRTSAEDVLLWLEDAQPIMMDVDDDGETQPLSDGLLIVRYLADFAGESLVANAVSNKGKRKDAPAIIEFLDQFNPSNTGAGPIARGPVASHTGFEHDAAHLESTRRVTGVPQIVSDSLETISQSLEGVGPKRSFQTSVSSVRPITDSPAGNSQNGKLQGIDAAFSDAIRLQF